MASMAWKSSGAKGTCEESSLTPALYPEYGEREQGEACGECCAEEGGGVVALLG